jgi:hypothetical protein
VLIKNWLSATLVSVTLATTGFATAAEKSPEFTFSRLRSSTSDVARKDTEKALKILGNIDGKAIDGIWANTQLSVLDRTIESFKLVDPQVEKWMTEAVNSEKSAPKAAPAVFKDAKVNGFYKANLGLAYAKSLCGARVYEEALEVLKSITPEQTVDPASYYFHRAVAEHATIKKEDAMRSILRLLEDVADAPDRYKMVAGLMFIDMQKWSNEDKDLGNISRMMDNIERRLDLSRGGEKTQELQKKVLFRLDELIKEMENQCKGNCNGNCPNGGSGQKPGGGQGPNPMQDSFGGTNGGQGTVDEKKLKNLQENWGKMPEKERAKAMQDLTKDLPAKYKLVIEEYMKSLSRANP